MKIRIYYDNINFRLKRSFEIKRFLTKVIMDEKKKPGDLIFIFTADSRIKDINKEFLSHDYFTDVVSFNYSEGNTINGEIYLSIDTIRYNAKEFKVTTAEEVFRTMIHGTLHLLGYEDNNKENRNLMLKVQEEKLKEFLGGK